MAGTLTFPTPSTVAGGPNSPVIAGTLAPVLWDSQITVNLYQEALAPHITIGAEDTITSYGCQLHRLRVPKVTVAPITRNGEVDHPELQYTDDVLTVDWCWGAAFSVDDITKVQQSIDSLMYVATDAGRALKKQLDVSILATTYAEADTYNYGNTAGKISQNLTLGALSGNLPIGISASNASLAVQFARTVLNEQEAPPNEDAFMVWPSIGMTTLYNSELKAVFVTGQSETPLTSGYLGKIRNVELYESAYLKTSTKVVGGTTYTTFVMPFGLKRATTFAMQAMKTRTGQMERKRGDYMDTMLLSGWKTFQPEILGYIYAYFIQPTFS